MYPQIASDRQSNLLGSLWMIAAMAGFAVEDSFLKAAATSLPVGQVMVIFGLIGAVLFACLARFTGQPLFVPAVVSRPMRIRMVFEIIGRLFYTLAITSIPLSAATVILQATPLVVVIGATLVFGETVGWRRWTAIAIGFLGVVFIIQPGTDSFSALSILAIIGMIGFAGRDLASRAAPATLSTWLLGLYGFLAIVVAGLIYQTWQGISFVAPDLPALMSLLAATAAGVTAYSCLMKAMRTGEVSAVTPFRYTRLIFGIALGVLVFGEKLTLPMMAGSLLIVISGLFIMWRGKAVQQTAA